MGSRRKGTSVVKRPDTLKPEGEFDNRAHESGLLVKEHQLSKGQTISIQRVNLHKGQKNNGLLVKELLLSRGQTICKWKAKLRPQDKNGLLKVRGPKLSSTKTTSEWKVHSKASLLRNGLQVKELLWLRGQTT